MGGASRGAQGMIQVEHLSKSFGGIHAVEDCSLAVARGSIPGLIGPNGAGKSTLFNIIAGLFAPNSGNVRLDGEDVTGWPAHRLFHRGLGRTFQIAQEFSRMTVIENLMVVPPKQSGENLFVPTAASGEALVGDPLEDGRGGIRQGFLEGSNVDPVIELVNLIRTQRAFEMNSQSIQAADEALQTVGQLRRF